jgi:hypothetical protein
MQWWLASMARQAPLGNANGEATGVATLAVLLMRKEGGEAIGERSTRRRRWRLTAERQQRLSLASWWTTTAPSSTSSGSEPAPREGGAALRTEWSVVALGPRAVGTAYFTPGRKATGGRCPVQSIRVWPGRHCSWLVGPTRQQKWILYNPKITFHARKLDRHWAKIWENSWR